MGVQVYVPPTSAGGAPTVNTQVIDPTGTPTVGTPTLIDTIPANTYIQRSGEVDNGRIDQVFTLADGQDENDLGVWVRALSAAHAAQTPTNEVLLEVVVDPTGLAITQYFPARALSVRDQATQSVLTVDSTIAQRSWSVGVAEVDTAFTTVRAGIGATAQTGQWGDNSLNQELQLSIVIVEAVLLSSDVAVVQDAQVAQILADGFDRLETATRSEEIGLVMTFHGDAPIATTETDVFDAIKTAVAAADRGVTLDEWDQVAALWIKAAGPMTVNINGSSRAFVADEALAEAVTGPKVKTVYTQLKATATGVASSLAWSVQLTLT